MGIRWVYQVLCEGVVVLQGGEKFARANIKVKVSPPPSPTLPPTHESYISDIVDSFEGEHKYARPVCVIGLLRPVIMAISYQRRQMFLERVWNWLQEPKWK